jgi:basic membrane lipoprotein Med (substrate-binding protein (PBP1-ABC) superfamily)
MISGVPDHVNVAFVHPLDIQTSTWVGAHENGRQYMEETLGSAVTVHSYFNAHNPEKAEAVLEQAVTEGADVVFTTTSQLSLPTLKAALKYPKVRFLNCSVDTPYSSIRTYYSRIYEAKFITGAIAGAMANNDRIGYIGSYPIFGVPASINAFALGAQLTNPRAKISLRWSCLGGNPVEDFIASGINVMSNRDVPTADKKYLEFGTYGTYMVEDGILSPLGSPVWLWGHFYENVIRAILNGNWDKGHDSRHALNYWWGMASGVIDVRLADTLPEGLTQLCNMLREGLRNGALDPFKRKLVDQDGRVVNDGSRTLSPEELLHMDWLCENVEGSIPDFDEIAPFAKDMVRELGVRRDIIPMEKEGDL